MRVAALVLVLVPVLVLVLVPVLVPVPMYIALRGGSLCHTEATTRRRLHQVLRAYLLSCCTPPMIECVVLPLLGVVQCLCES